MLRANLRPGEVAALRATPQTIWKGWRTPPQGHTPPHPGAADALVPSGRWCGTDKARLGARPHSDGRYGLSPADHTWVLPTLQSGVACRRSPYFPWCCTVGAPFHLVMSLCCAANAALGGISSMCWVPSVPPLPVVSRAVGRWGDVSETRVADSPSQIPQHFPAPLRLSLSPRKDNPRGGDEVSAASLIGHWNQATPLVGFSSTRTRTGQATPRCPQTASAGPWGHPLALSLPPTTSTATTTVSTQ